MSRSYMRLDERPEPPPEKKRLPFDDRKKFYSDYPSMKHESDLAVISRICLIIALLGLVSAIIFVLFCSGIISTDWSFIAADNVREWMVNNNTTVFIILFSMSAVMMVSAAFAEISGVEQEHYRRGLAAYIIMAISSVWTIIIAIISIFMMVRYMRAKALFFS